MADKEKGYGVRLYFKTAEAQKQLELLQNKLKSIETQIEGLSGKKIGIGVETGGISGLRHFKQETGNALVAITQLDRGFNALVSSADKLGRVVGNVANSFLNTVKTYGGKAVKEAVSYHETLARSKIGFSNFYGKSVGEALVKEIRKIATSTPLVDTKDLASYVAKLAPVSRGNSKLALDSAIGITRAVHYSGSSPTEIPRAITNIIDVIAKGKANAKDIQQFNRQMPALTRLITELGESKFLKNGQLSIDENNVKDLMALFSRIGKESSAKDADSQVAKTLSGAWLKLKETTLDRLNSTLEDKGFFKSLANIVNKLADSKEVGNVLDKIADGLGRFVGWVSNLDFEKIIDGVSGFFGEIAKSAREVVKSLGHAIGARDGVELARKFGKVVGSVLKGWGDAMSSLVRLARPILDNDGAFNTITKLGSLAGVLMSPLSRLIQFMLGSAKLLASAKGRIEGMDFGGTGLIDGGDGGDGGIGDSSLFGSLFGGSYLASKLHKRRGSSVLSKIKNTKAFAKAGGLFSKVGSGLGAIGGKLRGGLGTMIVGNFISELLGGLGTKLTGSKEFGGIVNSVGKLGTNIAALGPMFGSLVTIGENTVKLIAGTVANAKKKVELDKQAYDIKTRSGRDGLKFGLMEKLTDFFRGSGRFEHGDRASEHGLAKMEEVLGKGIASGRSINELVDEANRVYLEQRASMRSKERLEEWAKTDAYKGKGVGHINYSAHQSDLLEIAKALEKLKLTSVSVGSFASGKTLEQLNANELANYLTQNGVDTSKIVSRKQIVNLKDKLRSELAEFDKETNYDMKQAVKFVSGGEQFDTWEQVMDRMGFAKTADGYVNKQDINLIAKLRVDKEKSWTDKLGDEVREEARNGDIIGAFFKNMLHTIATPFDLIGKAVRGRSMGGFAPIYRSSGGYAIGVDTVPAMLQPGEFIVRESASRAIGANVLNALNTGDFARAYMSMGAKFGMNKTYSSADYSQRITKTNHIVNNIRVINRSGSGTLNSYRNLANRLALG